MSKAKLTTRQEAAQERVRKVLGNLKGKVKTEEIDAALRSLSKDGGSSGSF